MCKLKTFKTGSQCQNILEFLQDGNTLTAEQCRDNKWGSNLAQRIANLKEVGYNIEVKYVDHAGGYHAEYYMEDNYIVKIQAHNKCLSVAFNHDNDIMCHEDKEKIIQCKFLDLKEIYEKLNEGYEIYPF